VRAGSLLLDSVDPDSQLASVGLVIVHPLFDGFHRNVVINDVALLRHSKPVVFTNTVGPICFPAPNVNLAQCKVCIATGFGLTRSNAGTNSYSLLNCNCQNIVFLRLNYNMFLYDSSNYKIPMNIIIVVYVFDVVVTVVVIIIKTI